MKKSSSLLLITSLLLISFFSTHISAVVLDNNPPPDSVCIVDAEAAPGESVDVVVLLGSVSEIASVRFQIEYDDSALDLTKLTYNRALGGVSQQPEELSSPIPVNWINYEENFSGSATFLTLTFDVASNADSGEYPLTITYDEEDIFNLDEENVDITFLNGVIRVAEETADPNAPAITLSPISTPAGNTVTVPVVISNNPGIVSMTLEVEYDENVMTLKEVNDTSLMPGGMHTTVYTSPYTLTWENDTSTTNYYVNGTIAKLVFEISEDATVGEYRLNVSYPKDGIYNYTAENIDFNMVAGTITVCDYIYGDVNGDGEITNKDRLQLSRYLAKWEGYSLSTIIAEASDVNADGELTNKDRLILSRYLAKWDGYSTLPMT